MGPFVSDILQITDVQTYLGQTLLNVYFYRMLTVGAATDYSDIQTAFQTGVTDVVRQLQSTALTHVRGVIKNLTDGLSIAEFPISIAGERGTDPASSLLAYAFRLVRATALTRHGQKRIGGVAEGDVVANDINSDGLIYAVPVAAALAAHISETGVGAHAFTAEPVIVGRVKTPGPTYGDLDLTKINQITAGQYIRLTSQTTRRAGRGI